MFQPLYSRHEDSPKEKRRKTKEEKDEMIKSWKEKENQNMRNEKKDYILRPEA